MALTTNEADHPDVLLAPANRTMSHTIVDVNPRPGQDRPVLLTGAAAVFASLRNLFMCPEGGRSRIFQEDYYSGIYFLLQEPFDGITAQKLSAAVYDAIRIWEPRVTVNASDVIVVPDAPSQSYMVTVHIRMGGSTYSNTYSLSP